MKILGISDSDNAIFNDLVLKPLKLSGVSVWLFGSRARGDYNKFSDVDLLISTDKDSCHSLVMSCKENIEESLFPYVVDFVFESELVDSYKANVDRDKIKIS